MSKIENIKIISSNYDYTNDNNIDKTNINSNLFLDQLENKEDIIVLSDNNLAGYLNFIKEVDKFNKKQSLKEIFPIVSLKYNDKVYYAKNKDELEILLQVNNPFFQQENIQEKLDLISTELNESNISDFKRKMIYGDVLNIKTGHFSPKYNGRYNNLLNPDNDFEELKLFLKKRISEKLNITDENTLSKYFQRIDDEVSVLSGQNKMGANFIDYMLVVSDIVETAEENDILVGPGRGSGAGSLVAYSLGITDIDPLEYDLSFERFLNKDRISFPDFDLDFDSSKLNILKDLIKNKLGYSIIQIGTLNSHSHNDFLPKINELSFLSQEEKQKIFYSIKNDFDLSKEDVLNKNSVDYISEKFNEINYDINKVKSNIESNIVNQLGLKSKEQLDLLLLKNNKVFESLINKMYDDSEFKKVINKIGFDFFSKLEDKNLLTSLVDLKVEMIKAFNSGIDKNLLMNFEKHIHEELLDYKIESKFYNFLITNQQLELNSIDNINLVDLINLNSLFKVKEIGDFNKYSDYIKLNIDNHNINDLNTKFLEDIKPQQKDFYLSIMKYVGSENKEHILGKLNFIENTKQVQQREIDNNIRIYEELFTNNGLINSFNKNFETYKGLGAHASGHIIVSESQFQEMLKTFPILLQKDDKGKIKNQVMGVNHKFVEDLGGVKFDLLGLKTLTVYDIAKRLSKAQINNDLFKRGTESCERIVDFLAKDKDLSFIFQAEGVEIKTSLNIIGRRLQENKDLNLISAVSDVIALARPGPIANGTLYDYLSNGEKTIDKLSDSNLSGDTILEIKSNISKLLNSTNGYLIYQEQVIEVAKIIGLTGGEADNFRRAISKKNVELLNEQKELFLEKGLNLCGDSSGNKDYFESIFNALASFAEYGFNKSHSVAYSKLCCEGLHYACEYPKEFSVALFNTYGGEVNLLEGSENFKDVLKSNTKIPNLIQFVSSLGVNIQSYWKANNIQEVDINKDTDKIHKVATSLKDNNVVLGSKILNSKNNQKVNLESNINIGNLIGKKEIVDISNIRFGNLKNLMLKFDNKETKVNTIAKIVKQTNGKIEAVSNDKKYYLFLNKDCNINNLKIGEDYKIEVNLTYNSQQDKVYSNVSKISSIPIKELDVIKEDISLEKMKPKFNKDIIAEMFN